MNFSALESHQSQLNLKEQKYNKTISGNERSPYFWERCSKPLENFLAYLATYTVQAYMVNHNFLLLVTFSMLGLANNFQEELGALSVNTIQQVKL